MHFVPIQRAKVKRRTEHIIHALLRCTKRCVNLYPRRRVTERMGSNRLVSIMKRKGIHRVIIPFIRTLLTVEKQEIGRETAINRIAHRINTLKDANRSEKQPVMNPQLAGIGGIPNRKRGITRTRHKQSPFEIQFILNPFARLNALPHRNRLRSERPTAQQ